MTGGRAGNTNCDIKCDALGDITIQLQYDIFDCISYPEKWVKDIKKSTLILPTDIYLGQFLAIFFLRDVMYKN